MTGVLGPGGVEWVRAVEALERVPGLSRATLDSWVARGQVRQHRLGRESWVAWPDVLEREAVAALARLRTGRHAGGRG